MDRIFIKNDCDSDIKIYVNGQTFTEKDYQYINQMSQIIEQSGQPDSNFEIGNLTLRIDKKIEYTEDLIKL